MSEALAALGFTSFFAAQITDDDADLVPARITAEGQDLFWLAGARAPLGAMTGKLRRDARPVVGDWVLVADDADRASIRRILERRTSFARRAAGTSGDTQVLAVNVDVVFIVTSANQDLNPRRLERYLTAARSGGATPVVVINKVDLIGDPAPLFTNVRTLDADVAIIGTCARDRGDIVALTPYLRPGATVAFVGSSGVGKSSLTNRLLGSAMQSTAELITAGRGRHTTTRRELFVCASGALVIDTPGMRELGLVEDIDVDATFPDVAALAAACRFNDCKHEGEPGCAVQAALASGALAPERFASYRKLESEAASPGRSESRHPRIGSKSRKR